MPESVSPGFTRWCAYVTRSPSGIAAKRAHPVRDERTGTVTITAQNHGYAVDPERLAASAAVSHVNLNDGTVEGLSMRDEPVMTIQYHSEASPGPLDSMDMFDRFVEMMDSAGGRR